MNDILSARGLSVTKGKRELLNFPGLAMAKGEFLAITGPNGAGKSTLLKVLACLEPSQGEIFFNGEKITGSSGALKARRQMAMVFQDPLLLRGSALENVTIGLKIRGIDKRARTRKAEYWLDKLNIGHLAKRDVRTLSGGEAQRVNLARAMAMEPEILFLDEPFTYLDVPTRAALVSELKQILTETNTTTLMVTHDLTDVPYLADRMLVIIEGMLRQVGPVAEVLAQPKSRQVAEFLGVENIWEGKLMSDPVGGDFLHIEGLEQPLALGPRKYLKDPVSEETVVGCIRPEHVTILVGGQPEGRDKANVFWGTIEAVYPFGYYYRIKVNLSVGTTTLVGVTAMMGVTEMNGPPKPGERVSVRIPSKRIHIISTALG